MAGTQRSAYDGTDLIAEYNASNAMLRRYVFGPGTDEPIVWYEGSGTTDRRFLHQDERGTVMAVTNSSGTTLNVNTYDEYGKPASADSGRFLYTGQAYLPEVGLYDYKARMYASGLGRFMQTDPSGYGPGLNLYNYVNSDPINFSDPLGLCNRSVLVKTPSLNPVPVHDTGGATDIVVTARYYYRQVCLDSQTGGTSTGDGSIWSRIVRVAKAIYCTIAPRPVVTSQASATGSLSGFGGAVSAGYTVAIDHTGSITLFQTDGGYKSIGGGAASTLTAGGSTAKNVGDLAGPFATASITAAEAGGITGNGFAGSSPDGHVIGGEAGLDLGLEDSVMWGVNRSKPIAGISCH